MRIQGRARVLTPRDGRLVVDLHGEAATILKLSSSSQNRAKRLDDVAEQLAMVAGARNHLDLQLERLLAAMLGLAGTSVAQGSLI